jgi:hypothetical protein
MMRSTTSATAASAAAQSSAPAKEASGMDGSDLSLIVVPIVAVISLAAIHATPTSSTQPLAGSAPMPSALNKKNTYCPATWARLAMTSTSATMIAQPPAHPDLGPNARLAQVKVAPQSGSALFSSL